MEMLSSLGNFISSDAKPLTSLLGAAGAGANIYSGVEQAQQQSRINSAQNYIMNLVQNPAKMSAAAAQYATPLTAGLTADISNQVQGNLAERGLGSSPAAYTQQLTQALAPYIQNQQSTALQTLLSSLGLTANMKTTTPSFANISKLLAGLQSPSSPSSGTSPVSFSSLFGNADPLGLEDASFFGPGTDFDPSTA